MLDRKPLTKLTQMQVYNNFDEMAAANMGQPSLKADMSVFNHVPTKTEEYVTKALREIRPVFSQLLDAVNPAHYTDPDAKQTLTPIYEQYVAAEEALNAAGKMLATALGK